MKYLDDISETATGWCHYCNECGRWFEPDIDDHVVEERPGKFVEYCPDCCPECKLFEEMRCAK